MGISFVSECCEIDLAPEMKFFTLKDQAYEAWQGWCVNQGRKPGMKDQFGKWFLAACPGIKSDRISISGRRHNVYEGVKLADWVTGEYLNR